MVARPRTFTDDDAVSEAELAFWQHGYRGAALRTIEISTGLGRSSLYHAFGSKEALFQEALDRYIDTFTTPLLSQMESAEASPDDVSRFFADLASHFRSSLPQAAWGCLWVNAIADASGRDDAPDCRASEFAQRLLRAFSNALRGEEHNVVDRRANLLAATTTGIWLLARVDRSRAADICDGVALEVGGWAR